MKTSDQTNELDAALSEFMGLMPMVKKDVAVSMKGTSKAGKEFNVNYEYAPLESIQFIANPILSKLGLNITQDISFELLPTNTILHLIYTRVAHKSGQFKVSKWPLDMSGVTKEQDRGSKITFNKRYAYAAALNIALSDEDTDAVGVAVGNNKPAQQPVKQQPQSKAVDVMTGNPFDDYTINAGPNSKLTGTKLKDHSPDFLLKTVESSEKWHKDNNKTPHKNTKEFAEMVTAYLKHIDFLPF